MDYLTPQEIWNNPTPDELESYNEFLESWNDESENTFSVLECYDTDILVPFFRDQSPKQWQPNWCPGINLSHHQARDLVLGLPLREGTGKHLEDLSGNKNHGTIQGTPNWGISEYHGNALTVATHAKVEASDSLVFDDEPFSVSFWCKQDSANVTGGLLDGGVNRQMILSQHQSHETTPDKGFRFYYDTDPASCPATAQVSVRIPTAADDGHWSLNFHTGVRFGKDIIGETSASVNAFCRFTGVGVPQGAKITCAKLYFTPATDGQNITPVNVTIRAEDIDNSSTPTGMIHVTNSAKTTSSVDWNSVPAWDDGDGLDSQSSPDISCVIQEVIDRGGWGGALTLYLLDNGSATGFRTPVDYSSNPAMAVRLDVSYTTQDNPTLTFEVPTISGDPIKAIFDADDGNGSTNDCWLHVIGTVKKSNTNANIVRMYVNGRLIMTGASYTDLAISEGPLGIGAGFTTTGTNDDSADNNPFTGMLKDIRIYSRCLLLGEVKDIWNNGVDLYNSPLKLNVSHNLHQVSLTLIGEATIATSSKITLGGSVNILGEAIISAEEASAGSIQLKGEATLTLNPSHLVAASASMTGTATVAAAGSLFLGGFANILGEATVTANLVQMDSGGVRLSGSALTSGTANETATGGARLGRTAIYGVVLPNSIGLICNGTLSVNGVALKSGSTNLVCVATVTAGGIKVENAVGIGGIKASGTALLSTIIQQSTSSGVKVSGSTSQGVNGLVSIIGTATITTNEVVIIPMKGGARASGTALLSTIIQQDVSGGVLLSGIKMITSKATVNITGDATISASVIRRRSNSLSLVCDATISAPGARRYANIDGVGGIKAGGTAIISSLTNVALAGGVKVSGQSTTNAPQRASASLTCDATLISIGVAKRGSTLTITGDATLSVASAITIVNSIGLVCNANITANSVQTLSGSVSVLGECIIGASLLQTPEHILKELRTFLVADETLSDLVDSRIYPMRLPQSPTYPCVTYSRISHQHGHHFDNPAGHATPRIQLDFWADDFSTCKEMSEATRGILAGYSGQIESVNAMSVVLEDEIHLHEPPQHATDEWLYHITQDYYILHNETIPVL